MIQPVIFPEVTSTQINLALVTDKLNEMIADYNTRFPDPKPANAFQERQLKPGVRITKNGRFVKVGKGGGMVKESEAYLNVMPC